MNRSFHKPTSDHGTTFAYRSPVIAHSSSIKLEEEKKQSPNDGYSPTKPDDNGSTPPLAHPTAIRPIPSLPSFGWPPPTPEILNFYHYYLNQWAYGRGADPIGQLTRSLSATDVDPSLFVQFTRPPIFHPGLARSASFTTLNPLLPNFGHASIEHSFHSSGYFQEANLLKPIGVVHKAELSVNAKNSNGSYTKGSR